MGAGWCLCLPLVVVECVCIIHTMESDSPLHSVSGRMSCTPEGVLLRVHGCAPMYWETVPVVGYVPHMGAGRTGLVVVGPS